MSGAINNGRRAARQVDFDLDTASGVDRFIAISHHAQQKVCATVLQSSLIEQMLERPDLDRSLIKQMLGKIMATSYAAAEAVSELQRLVQDHPASAAFAAAPQPASMRLV